MVFGFKWKVWQHTVSDFAPQEWRCHKAGGRGKDLARGGFLMPNRGIVQLINVRTEKSHQRMRERTNE
jgi:hypothetical protein